MYHLGFDVNPRTVHIPFRRGVMVLARCDVWNSRNLTLDENGTAVSVDRRSVLNLSPGRLWQLSAISIHIASNPRMIPNSDTLLPLYQPSR